MPTLPRAILFDLDDTLIVSGQRPSVLEVVAAEFGAEITPWTPSELARRLDAAFAVFWADPVRHKAARFAMDAARRGVVADVFAGMATPGLTPRLADRLADRFAGLREEMTQLVPLALETLVTLRERGVRLALVTNGPSDVQRAKIERFALAPLFHHIQIEGEHGFGKPEERAYRHAMDVLGVQPRETWMVGDNLEWEVAAPQRLGIHAVWFDAFDKGLPADADIHPDRTIRAIADLLG